jgi:hypothetical protein
VLSDETRAEITRLTDKALRELPPQDAIDRVAVIRGYAQLLLLHPERKDYKDRLADALLDLAEVANRHGRYDLASDLESLTSRIDQQDPP